VVSTSHHYSRATTTRLEHNADFGPNGSLSADEVRSLALPGTRLTWRFLEHDGYADWTLVLVDEQDAIVWVHRKGFFPDGYEQANIKPAPEPADQHDGHEPWMDEGLIMHGVYCVTLIQDVTPDEALRRFGAADNAISTATWRELLERACYEEMRIDDITAFEANTDNFLNDLELLRKLTSVNPAIADVTGPARVAIIAGTP
jgi:hypothetical protein